QCTGDAPTLGRYGRRHSRSGFELILDENDCQLCAGHPSHTVVLSGAYNGSSPVYFIRVLVPALRFDRWIRVAGVSRPPRRFDGIAGFRFLNRFTYGNFSNRGGFGLEL